MKSPIKSMSRNMWAALRVLRRLDQLGQFKTDAAQVGPNSEPLTPCARMRGTHAAIRRAKTEQTLGIDNATPTR
jgi:hypothetical protein